MLTGAVKEKGNNWGKCAEACLTPSCPHTSSQDGGGKGGGGGGDPKLHKAMSVNDNLWRGLEPMSFSLPMGHVGSPFLDTLPE